MTLHRIFDPLAGEYASPIPAGKSMTNDAATAALFESESAAVLRARQLIGPERPWLVMQPAHLTDKGAA